MKKSSVRLCQALGLTLLAGLTLVDASAQENNAQKSQPRGMYVVMPPHLRNDVAPQAASLETWNGSFTYSGSTYSYNMVGAAPSSNTSATIPTYIVPVKIVITSKRKQYTYDPSHVLSNGKTVTNNTVASPIFDATTTYVQGGVDVGTTQYIDAFQRANFWGTVSGHTNSHLLLGSPTVVSEVTLTVPTTYGKTGSPFGFTAGLVDINWFDAQLPNIIASEGIQPNALPIFLTYDKGEWSELEKKSIKKRVTEQVNSASALWRRPKSELKDEDYKELYKAVAGGWDDPLFWFHTKAEGSLEYTTLFYIPSKAPLDL